MQLFSADPTVTEKKCIHENLKIRASKVAHNQLKPFFYSPAQPQSPQPRIIINTYVPRHICLLICAFGHVKAKTKLSK